MSLPEIVSADEWVAARTALLEREKELTRARDALSADRRRLPMVRSGEGLPLGGPRARSRLDGLFDGAPAARRRALHVRPLLGGRLPELLGRRRRGLRGPPPPPSGP